MEGITIARDPRGLRLYIVGVNYAKPYKLDRYERVVIFVPTGRLTYCD